MGMDKEATDIWKFGRPRPDLTHQESFDAPFDIDKLEPEERQRREDLVNEHFRARFDSLVTGIKIGYEVGQHHERTKGLKKV